MCRLLHIDSLEAVCFAPGDRRPSSRQKLSPAQRAGLAFQRKLAKALPFSAAERSEAGISGDSSAERPILHISSWLAFRDRNGAGLAQPDIFALPLPDDSVLLVEAKLKLTERAISEAARQVEGLYGPLLHAFYGRDVKSLIVGRFLGSRTAVPLAELSWRDLGAVPLLAFWDGKRGLEGLAC
jgi:hypothetical protein